LILGKPLLAASTIAVLDLQARGLSSQDALVMTDRLRSELVNAGKYIVVDRANMVAILEEQEFQLSGCTTNECVIEIGELLGVQKMLSGSVSQVGQSFAVQLQITDVESSQIEHSVVYDSEGSFQILLTSGIKGALRELLGLGAKPIVFSALQSGFLRMEVDPADALVKIDGINYTDSQVNNIEMIIGEHIVMVSKPYFYPVTRSVVLNANSTVPLHIELKSGKELYDRILTHRKYSAYVALGLAGGAVFSEGISQIVYGKYETSETTADADKYRKRTEILYSVALTSITVAFQHMWHRMG